MDSFQLTIIAKTVSEWQWQDDPARHERRGPDGENSGARVGSQHAWPTVDKIASIFVPAVALLIGGALLTSGTQFVSPAAAAEPEANPVSLSAVDNSLATSPVEFVWQTTEGPDLPLDPSGGAVAPDDEFLEAWGEPGSADGQIDFQDPAFSESRKAKNMIVTSPLSLMLSLGATLVPPQGCQVVTVWEGGSAVAACADGHTWFEFASDITRDGLWSISRHEPPQLVALRQETSEILNQGAPGAVAPMT